MSSGNLCKYNIQRIIKMTKIHAIQQLLISLHKVSLEKFMDIWFRNRLRSYKEAIDKMQIIYDGPALTKEDLEQLSKPCKMRQVIVSQPSER